MAKYTIELRKVCDIYGRQEVENWFKSYNLNDYLTEEQINQIEKSGVWSKDKLATKIVNHYFMREIGFETPYLFKHYAEVTMSEIMERYLLKIYSKFFEYDPLSNVDYTETFTREVKGNSENIGKSTSSSSSNSNSMAINNDTPQGNITKQEIENGMYANNVAQSDNNSSIEDETNTNSNAQSNSTETYTRHMEGDNGAIITNQRLVKEYREIIVAIDEEIINELNILFMGLY